MTKWRIPTEAKETLITATRDYDEEVHLIDVDGLRVGFIVGRTKDNSKNWCAIKGSKLLGFYGSKKEAIHAFV